MQNNDSSKQSSTSATMGHETFSAFEYAESPRPSGSDMEQEKQEYPKGLSLVTIVFALCLAVFCVALDNTVWTTSHRKLHQFD